MTAAEHTVLHLVHWPRSGVGAFVRDLSRSASPSFRHVVFCLSPGAPLTDAMREAGVQVLEPGPSGPDSRIASALRLRRALADVEPDLIHTHSLSPRLLALAMAGRRPHVTTVHSPYAYFEATGPQAAAKRLAECWAARVGHAVYVCVSDGVRLALPCAAMGAGARVIPNGVDIARVRTASREPAEHVPDRRPLLVAVGRLEPDKGFDTLLHALARVRDRFPDTGLVVCGEGTQRGALERTAARLGQGDHVGFPGHLANPFPLLAAADAYVSSSVREGYGLATVEAMLVRTATVLTPVGGVSAHVEDGVTGFLARDFGARELAAAIERALLDPDRLERVAGAGQRLAEERFGLDRTVNAYEALYRELIAS